MDITLRPVSEVEVEVEHGQRVKMNLLWSSWVYGTFVLNAVSTRTLWCLQALTETHH